jgi:hypothetical protein
MLGDRGPAALLLSLSGRPGPLACACCWRPASPLLAELATLAGECTDSSCGPA